MLDRRAPCAWDPERLLGYCLRVALGCAALLSWSSPVFAHTVALLQPPTHADGSNETVERLRGELLSLGFEVILTDRPAQSEGSQARAPDLRQELTVTGKVDAMIDVLSEATPPAVDVWIVDRAHGWSLIARVALEKNTENAAKSLAIRAIEVLRARLFESRLVSFDGRSQVPGPRASELVAAPKSGSSEPRGDFGFELGAATFASVAAVGPSIARGGFYAKAAGYGIGP